MSKLYGALFLATVFLETSCTTFPGRESRRVVFFEIAPLPFEVQPDYALYRRKSSEAAREAGYEVDFRKFADISDLDELFRGDLKPSGTQCQVGLVIQNGIDRQYYCGVMTDQDFRNLLKQSRNR